MYILDRSFLFDVFPLQGQLCRLCTIFMMLLVVEAQRVILFSTVERKKYDHNRLWTVA